MLQPAHAAAERSRQGAALSLALGARPPPRLSQATLRTGDVHGSNEDSRAKRSAVCPAATARMNQSSSSQVLFKGARPQ